MNFMSTEIANKMPIGWYLKEADTLITHFLNSAFETYGINRFHWQVMKNIDTHGKISKELFYHQVNRFLSKEELGQVLELLLTRKWILQEEDNYSFTVTGREEYKQIAALQQSNKEKIMEGTSPEDYLTTITFLEAIIKNMGGKI